MSDKFDGNFYDADYFERGKESGKGWLENYRWMPRRTFKEAFAFIDTLRLNESSYVLEVGCAKGFLIKALRTLDIRADGCDISKYALSFAPEGCWNCEDDFSWELHKNFGYTHIIIKDMLEHLTKEQLPIMLNNFAKVAKKMMCVVPLGDNGVYRIPEYHTEVSHLIAEDMTWWKNKFLESGWKLMYGNYYIKGLKDNWYYVEPLGNFVFILEHE